MSNTAILWVVAITAALAVYFLVSSLIREWLDG